MRKRINPEVSTHLETIGSLGQIEHPHDVSAKIIQHNARQMIFPVLITCNKFAVIALF